MIHGLSTHLFVNHRLTTASLERIWNAGIPLVEFFCARQHFDYRNKEQVAELGHWFRDTQLKLHSMHSPMYSDDVWGRTGPDALVDITERVKLRRIAAVDEIKRALEVAETVPFRFLIQHIGVGGAEYDEHKVDSAFSSLEELSLFARQRGVEVLLENTPNDLSSAERLLLFLQQTHLDLNLCLDVGHANMNEGVATAFRAMRSRLRSTHIHDNNGVDDSHLFPLVAAGGTIDWGHTMDSLRMLDVPLMLELKEVPGLEHPLDAVRESLDRLERAKSKNES
jgi:sugar phosphate isomerase/epimerase